MGYSKHEFSTINMLYTPPKYVILHPYLHITATSPTKATFLRPQGDRCGQVRLYKYWDILTEN